MSGAGGEVVTLSGAEPFATGGRRWCYVDPRDPGRCIKVNRTDAQRFGRTQAGILLPARWRREYDNNADEHRELTRLMRRLGPDRYDHLPRAHGYVRTDLGRGLVLDLIRDAEGPISRTLRELVCEGHAPDEFRSAFEDLSAYLLGRRVLTRALLDHNVVAQKQADGSWRLVVIDGVGDRAWVPVARWFPPLGRAKIRQRLRGCWERLEELARERPPANAWDTARWSQGFLDHRGV